jgi:hypothetical protein
MGLSRMISCRGQLEDLLSPPRFDEHAPRAHSKERVTKVGWDHAIISLFFPSSVSFLLESPELRFLCM